MGGELQVEKYSCRRQMKNGGGFPRRTTVVSFKWKTTALGCGRRTAVVGFKWKTLVVSGLLQVNNCCGWLQMENGGGHPRRRTAACVKLQQMSYRPRSAMVGFKWSLSVVVGFAQRTQW